MGDGADSKHKRRNWETEDVLILLKVPGKKGHNDKGLGIGRLSTMEGKLCWWVPC